MRKDAHIPDSTYNSIINQFDQYSKDKGYPTEENLISLPVVVLTGYFLKVHSKHPELALMRYTSNHSISYKKAMEVKMMIHALETR